MATICARRRLIRDGAELKNEPNCRISPIPQVPAEAVIPRTGARQAKMFSRPARVETAVKIATHPSSDGRLAVDLLSPAARQRSKSSPRKFRTCPRFSFQTANSVIASVNEDVSRTRCSALVDARKPGPIAPMSCPGQKRLAARARTARIRSTQIHFRLPAARSARVVHERLRPTKGAGNAGCPLHPQPRV